jgi:hypothetical protein
MEMDPTFGTFGLAGYALFFALPFAPVLTAFAPLALGGALLAGWML